MLTHNSEADQLGYDDGLVLERWRQDGLPITMAYDGLLSMYESFTCAFNALPRCLLRADSATSYVECWPLMDHVPDYPACVPPAVSHSLFSIGCVHSTNNGGLICPLVLVHSEAQFRADGFLLVEGLYTVEEMDLLLQIGRTDTEKNEMVHAPRDAGARVNCG